MKQIVCCTLLFIALAFTSVSAQSRAAANYMVEDVPGELKINVNIWGYINYPGRYEIPISTNLIQLITFAGGPKTHAIMDEIIIYRVNSEGNRRLIEVDLEDPDEATDSDIALRDEDTIVIDYSSVVSFREIFSVIATPLAIATSILVIIRETNR